MASAELTLRECLLAEAIESANDIEVAKLKGEIATLRNIIRDFHWMARRYADGRSSYAPGMFNRHVQALINLDFEFADNAPRFARDGMGRDFDGLTEADTRAAEEDMPRAFQQHVEESTGRKQKLVDAAVTEEREACAKLCDALDHDCQGLCAQAIRARSGA